MRQTMPSFEVTDVLRGLMVEEELDRVFDEYVVPDTVDTCPDYASAMEGYDIADTIVDLFLPEFFESNVTVNE